MKLRLSLLLIFISSYLGFTQKVWSLKDCTAYALSHNLEIKDSQLETQIAKSNVKQIHLNLIPHLGASSGYSINFGRYIDNSTNSYINTSSFSNSYSVSSSLTLFNGFRVWNSILMSKYNFSITEQNALSRKQELINKVIQNYYDVVYAKQTIAIAEEQLQISKSNLKLVNKQVELGLKATSDVYSTKAAILKDSLSWIKAVHSTDELTQLLLNTMNLPRSHIQVVDSLITESVLPTLEDVSWDEVYKDAVSHVPTIKINELLIQSAQRQVAIARSTLFPSLSFGAGISTGYYQTRKDENGNIVSFSNQIKNNAGKYLGFSLNIPISSLLQSRSDVKVAKIRKEKAQLTLEKIKLELKQQVQQTVQRYKTLQVERAVSNKNLELSIMEFEIAQKKFENGLIDFFVLSEMKTKLAQAKIACLQVAIQQIGTQWLLNYYRNSTLLF